VPSLLKDTSTFTLLISTHSRFQLLSEQLSYYSASPVISTIVVTWHHMQSLPLPDAQIRGTHIRFESPSTDSLNNRFLPLLHINTEAVLVLDDDIKLHLQDVYNMFVAWKQNKRNLVGVSPRWVDVSATDSSWAGGSSATPRVSTAPHDLIYLYQSEDSPNPHRGYSLMLTRAMMMHRDYMRLYTCGGESEGLGLEVPRKFDQLRSLILETVETESNCEDIGMNFIVNAAMDSANASERTAAPLFVQPLHKIGDFGKMGDTGLHQKKSHVATRTTCLNQMNRAFWQATGRNLPFQTKIVDAIVNRTDGRFTDLVSRQYPGLTTRLHHDCLAIAGEGEGGDEGNGDGEGEGGGACSWQMPRRTDHWASFFPSHGLWWEARW
jgi:alpha-1,4-N-acetylglucosaminyltransferase EXTL2